MRQLVLDTETTGLSVEQGHRIIEIGIIELVNRRPTGNHFQRYVNPGRAVDEGAVQVHGITNQFLADKPSFSEVARDLWDWLAGDELVIHNAPFDVGFLDVEFRLSGIGQPLAQACAITDTVQMARKLHPGQKASLDALCRRYNVDNSNRELHGALLDARLLAEVYLALTRGQESLVMELDAPSEAAVAAARIDAKKLTVLRATEAELKAHEKILDAIDKAASGKGGSLWRRLGG